MVLSGKHCFLMLILCICASGLLCLEALPASNPLLIAANGLTTLTDDPSAASVNPAAGENGFSTSTSFLYGMSALNQYELASVIGYRNNSFIAAWQTLDNDDYQRQDFRLGIRYDLQPVRLAVGYKFLYDNIPGYSSAKDSRLSEGLRVRIKHTLADITIEHEIPPDKDQNVDTPALNLCLGQKLDDNSDVAVGFTAIHDLPVSYKLGCRFQVFRNFSALASWSSQPGSFGFGAIFNLRQFNLSYAVKTHPELDWTHSIGISAMMQ